MPQCTAKSKQSGQRCKRQATPGRTVCAMHGGKTPVGLALPQTKHGRYSKYLPELSKSRYEAALADPRLIELGDEIALVGDQIAQALELVRDGLAGPIADVVKHWRAFRVAYAGGDAVRLQEALTSLGIAVDRLEEIDSASDRLIKLIDLRRRLSESERKRLLDAQDVMTTEQARLFAQIVMDSVKRHVTDRDALNSISRDLIQFFTH